jgi:hypothetical protein
MRSLFALWLLCASSYAADAHSWYPSECCLDNHCHPVPCDSIKKDGIKGFWWFDDGSLQKIFFKREQVKASQDDYCHVCLIGWTGVCLFMPYRS